ncbi:MAG: bifunctional diaminohydroxyphosphoribosylaminopyrimidine deaminase/5-amino-6-(5-phosphoribosylamino)uracil reductase RibD [Gemmatimonadetes bacterium]|nr:bifunctional diaminohydroxyphosphoribosylaminopyrimidine deaminase/5-amino-6-(5-phosphoribosylamino)uracil reductase RibD [Gemmatimonadota bacterium]
MNDEGEFTAIDRVHLERARLLAHRGWGHVHPNPIVGCVIVRDGEMVAEGWHTEYGGPHAEVMALHEAGAAAEGATAYVSLEPCSHQGKTPPCTEALLRAGIGRVVYGAADPGEASRGGGARLREAGVEVVGPTWTVARARSENPAFMHGSRHPAPFIALKLAMTLDARIAAGAGKSTRITGPEAELEVHRLRKGFDAIMVGGSTATIDDARLTVRRVPPGRRAPARIVLSPDADLPPGARLFDDIEDAPVHVFCRADAPDLAVKRLEAEGAAVHGVAHNNGLLDLGLVSRKARELDFRAILCEGGGRLASGLLQEGRVQRLYLFVAPRTLGPGAVPAFPDGDRLDWTAFGPAVPPITLGLDTLIVLDRQEDSGVEEKA